MCSGGSPRCAVKGAEGCSACAHRQRPCRGCQGTDPRWEPAERPAPSSIAPADGSATPLVWLACRAQPAPCSRGRCSANSQDCPSDQAMCRLASLPRREGHEPSASGETLLSGRHEGSPEGMREGGTSRSHGASRRESCSWRGVCSGLDCGARDVQGCQPVDPGRGERGSADRLRDAEAPRVGAPESVLQQGGHGEQRSNRNSSTGGPTLVLALETGP